MTNYHATPEGRVPFSAEEEAEWKTENTTWALGARDRKAAQVRTERNGKIAACDWRMLIDSPGSAGWKVYRQALRDVPGQPGFPEKVVWPVAP